MVRAAAILAMLALSAVAAPAAAEVRTFVDRDPVPQHESFQLRFELDYEFQDAPDFTALERDFEILSRNQQTSISLLNGEMERNQTFVLELMAERSGRLTIPPIAFGGQSSRPLTIEVTAAPPPAAATRDVLLEVELSASEVYAQAQVLLIVRLLHAVRVNGSVSEPELPGADAMIEKLGDDAAYETRRGGRGYRAIERRYAVFPQRPGRFQLAPIRFQGQLGGSRGLLFDFGAGGRALRLRSEPLDLVVNPVPAEAQGLPWLPAGRVTLEEAWSGDVGAAPVGEPLTRTLTLTAAGQLAVQLPEMSAELPDGLKVYPDQPQLRDGKQSDGITAVRGEKLALVPTRPGRYQLPPLRIPWWDTGAGELRYAELPGRTIEAVGGGATPQNPAPAAQPAETPPGADQTIAPPPAPAAERWRLISLLLAAGWLASALWWWSRRQRGATSAPRPDDASAAGRRRLEADLGRACRADDAQGAETALLRLARLAWPAAPPAGLDELAARCAEPLAGRLHELERHRYGPDGGEWTGAPLHAAYRRAGLPEPDGPGSDSGPLEPLYPGAP